MLFNDITRVFVASKRNETRIPQMIRSGPFQKTTCVNARKLAFVFALIGSKHHVLPIRRLPKTPAQGENTA
jgi:hypothetical protein